MVDSRVQVRLGGSLGADLSLELGPDFIRGRLSYWLGGKDFDFRLAGRRLTGRIGGTFDGKDVNIEVGSVPLALAALAAACAYKALEDEQNDAAAASSGGSS